ncbi:MAG: nuclear transport factor 2 family protein [Bacteroidota bacterium]
MRTKLIFGLCIALFQIFYFYGQEGNKTIENDHPVRALFLSTIEAFNEGDLDLFLANFAQEVRMYGTDGVYNGQDALRVRVQAVFKQFPNKRMEIPELHLELLSEEVVMVHFAWKLYPMGQGPAYSGVGTGIYTLINGQWIEVLEVETVTEVDEALRQSTPK